MKKEVTVEGGAVKQTTYTDGDDGDVLIHTRKTINMEPLLSHNAYLRDQTSEHSKWEDSAHGTKIAAIDPVTCDKWAKEGFHILSPEKSGMTPEQHSMELMRRLELNPHFKTTKKRLLIRK